MPVAVIGTGLLGSGFTRAFAKRGEQVAVWNRTAAKAEKLADVARVAPSVVDAVRGVDRVHLALADDAAVDSVIEAARIAPEAIIVDHTTTSVAGAKARAARWPNYQHAPVFMGPQNALESTGVMLVSGPKARFEALQPELAKMTGKLVFLGEEPERAAAFKLFGNLFLMFLTTGVIEMLAFAKQIGFSIADAATIFESFDPGASLKARVKRVMAADFEHPSWELAMARKDARLMLDEVAAHGGALPMLPAIAGEMDRWIEKGFGNHDWTVIGKDTLR